MASFGSSHAPAWAGWDAPGAGYCFCAPWVSPNVDILVNKLWAYFNAFNQTGKTGWLCMWSGGGSLMASISFPNIASSGSGAGAGQWWGLPITPTFVARNTTVYLGGYCNGNLIFSTYDTSPHAVVKSLGTGGPTNFTFPTDTGQGPPGGYAEYTPLNVSGVVDVGNAHSGLLVQQSGNILKPGVTPLGNRQSGLSITHTSNFSGVSGTLGGSGGLAIPSVLTRKPKLRVWRP